MLDLGRYTSKTTLVVCTFVCVIFALVFCSAGPTWAAEFTVDSPTDAPDSQPGDGTCAATSGDCTLRAAIQETNFSSYDTITLPAGDYALSVEGTGEDDAATGDLDIVAGGLTIEGAGKDSTTVDGRRIDRVFDVRPDTWATISGVTITGGDPGFAAGGGARVRGQLELYDSAVTNNTAESGGGLDNSGGGELYTENTTIADNEATDGHGGGVYNSGGHYDGYLGLERSTLSNNTASEFGGGIYSTGYAWMWNATLSGNAAAEIGGGIRNFRNYLSLENVTLSDNSAPEGANIANDGDTQIWNTVVAGDTGSDENCSGNSLISDGGNLDSGTSCGLGESSDLSDTNPQLGELRNNGGPTPTHAPSSDSPVVDAVRDGYCSDIDQRGASRPNDGDGDGRAACDIGAYEFGQPVAKDDAYEIDEDEPLAIPASGVLGNDTDAEGDQLTTQLEDGPYHGTLELREDGSFVYTPNKNFSGYDHFSYRANDGASGGDVAEVTITVNNIADPPEAKDDSYWINEDSKLTVPGWVMNENGYWDTYFYGVLSNDSDPEYDPTTAKLVDVPENGTLTFNQNGSFEYVPNANFNGTDAFTYRANDGTADGNLATVNFDVKPINDAPNATVDTATTEEDSPVNINVLANDSDVESDALTVAAFTQPRNGRVTCTPEGNCTYTPNANFNGTDSFTYTVSDGTSGRTATVAVTITAVNDAPVARDDAAATDENKAVSISVLANDSDAERDTPAISSFTQGTNGDVTCAPAGTCTYKPKVGFNGVDSFTYTVSDGKGANSNARVTITVRSIDPPDTSITSGPSGTVSSGSASFSFSSTEPGGIFECSLDQAAFGNCTSPKSYTNLSDGPHTFKVRATGVSAEPDPTPASRSFTVDATPPDTTIDSGPSGAVNTSSATFTFSSTESGSTFQCSLDNGAYSSCASPKTYSALSEGAHTLRVKATDAADNADTTPVSRSWTVDTVSPDTTVTSGPSGLVNTKSASFGFSSSEAGSRLECSLDGAPFTPCTPPVSYADLPDGSHTFSVRAVDGAGNPDSTPASRSWTVDATAPTVLGMVPDRGAKGISTDANVEISFSEAMLPGSISGSTVTLVKQGTTTPVSATVTLDTTGKKVVLNPAASLSTDAVYTATVKGGSTGVKDLAGNTLAADETWSFSTLDTIVPDTTITSGPSGTVKAPSASFAFSSDEAGSSFECSLDDGAYAPCSSPQTYPDLADGSHTFRVKAKDEAGNTDATPAERTWTVDTVAPETTIISGPPGRTNFPTATFEFTGSESGSSFQCSLDGAAYSACTTPATYPDLSDGSHVFRVRAVDAAGNIDGTPASRNWTVDTVAPSVNSVTPPPDAKNVPTSISVEVVFSEAMVAGSINSSNLTLVKQGTTIPIGATVSYNGTARTATLTPNPAISPDSVYTATVKGGQGRVRDAAGNFLPSDMVWSFSTIDTIDPQTAIDSGPSGAVNTPSVSFGFSSNEENSSFRCSLDGASFTPCTSPQTYSGLSEGAHAFKVEAIDETGNVDESPASSSFTVDTTAPVVSTLTEDLDTSRALGTTAIPVEIGWSASDPSSGVVRYELEQSTGGGAYTPVSLASPTDITIDLSLAPNTTYQFRARALDGAGNWSPWKGGSSFRLTAVQENGAGVTYPTGTWTNGSSTGFYGDSVRYETDNGKARFTFSGTEVAWVATKASSRGKAEVYVDGVLIRTVDLYSATTEHRKMVFRRTGLDPTVTHTLEVRPLGTKNASSTNTRVDVDAFVSID